MQRQWVWHCCELLLNSRLSFCECSGAYLKKYISHSKGHHLSFLAHLLPLSGFSDETLQSLTHGDDDSSQFCVCCLSGTCILGPTAHAAGCCCSRCLPPYILVYKSSQDLRVLGGQKLENTSEEQCLPFHSPLTSL